MAEQPVADAVLRAEAAVVQKEEVAVRKVVVAEVLLMMQEILVEREDVEAVANLVAVYDEGKGRGLHPADAEHLSVLTVFHCIKSGGVHAENPVTDGTGKSGKIERLIFPLVFQFLEALLDGFIGHG